VDLDVFVRAHRGEWDRLETLVSKASSPRSLSGSEVDELVGLYQRVATHLSVVQSATPDPVVVGRLSSLVARARTAVSGSRQPAWRDVVTFLRVDFPAVLYRTRWWWMAVGAAFLLVSFGWAAYVANNPDVQSNLVSAEQARQLVDHDFEDYYHQAAPKDFAAKVFTNNALVAAGSIASGFLIVPVYYMLYSNALNVGIVGGLMASEGATGKFFGLILPHGMLELTAVFVAAALGLKLGWTIIDPGRRTRAQGLAEEGRALVVGAVGLALVLLVSGLIEGFVTPSSLPTWARIVIGLLAEAAFLWVVFVPGRRAVQQGATGDLADAGDVLPSEG
jgi:uncharacterized membrane protein SpoIIM required for sporulation